MLTDNLVDEEIRCLRRLTDPWGLSVHDYIFGTTRPIFTKISVHVTYGRGWVLLWRRSDASCTSGFVDDVMFAHKPRLLDVAAQLSAVLTQPRAWLQNVRSNTSCKPADARNYFSGV